MTTCQMQESAGLSGGRRLLLIFLTASLYRLQDLSDFIQLNFHSVDAVSVRFQNLLQFSAGDCVLMLLVVAAFVVPVTVFQ